MKDPYELLGVPRSVTSDELKAAYRRLAKQFHPDLNPGNKAVEQKFKDVNAAYDLLSDADKRARFDRGEIDANGNDRRHGFNQQRSRAGASAGGARSRGFGPDFDADDFFAEMFSSGRRKRAENQAKRGSDATYQLRIELPEAALGAKKRITLSDGKVIDISIPAGTEDGQTLRLKGKGLPGMGGAEAGDALVQVHVREHPFFERKGRDIHLELPVTLQEAMLGATVTVPTCDGRVQLKIPRGSNTGTMLRLKGKGGMDREAGDRGDQYVKLRIVLPDAPDREIISFIEKWGPKNPYDVRAKLGLE
jgi:DnaJ-class molecular chaperone